MVKKKQGQYEVLGVIRCSSFGRRPPVAAMVSRNVATGAPSVQVGFLRNGRIDPVRYWQGDAFMAVAALSVFLARQFSISTLSGTKITRAALKSAVGEQPSFEWVEQYNTQKRHRDIRLTLGERAKKDER